MSHCVGFDINREGIYTCAYVSYRAEFVIPTKVARKIPIAVYEAAPRIWKQGQNCGLDANLNMAILMELSAEKEDYELIYWLASFRSLEIRSSYADSNQLNSLLYDQIFISLSDS